MDVDKVCNLKCTKAGDVHEFVGPVKIVLVDPPRDEYRNNRIKATALSVASLLIGANNFCMICFCLGFNLPVYVNAHVLLCVLGHQFCMPFGIMMVNSLFGPAVAMEPHQRRKQHVFLQIFGMLLYLSGAALVILLFEKSGIDETKPQTSYHFYSGCLAALLAAVCILTGPCLLCIKSEKISSSCFTNFHRIFGILAFTTSTVCYILGLSETVFDLWFYVIGSMKLVIGYATRFICILAAIIVLSTPVINVLAKCQKKPKPTLEKNDMN